MTSGFKVPLRDIRDPDATFPLRKPWAVTEFPHLITESRTLEVALLDLFVVIEESRSASVGV
ncbi:hypothetical protein [Salinibacterium sp. ZJ450]|uniref:hypothetical protein n=1 Tax=Salinibacterium sp. ZJ450 TaxID=2708338 RepID=UPI00141DEDB2|nr:hypothetical protein [Salinibacterium sp. ZJ450]